MSYALCTVLLLHYLILLGIFSRLRRAARFCALWCLSCPSTCPPRCRVSFTSGRQRLKRCVVQTNCRVTEETFNLNSPSEISAQITSRDSLIDLDDLEHDYTKLDLASEGSATSTSTTSPSQWRRMVGTKRVRRTINSISIVKILDLKIQV